MGKHMKCLSNQKNTYIHKLCFIFPSEKGMYGQTDIFMGFDN